MSDATVTNTPKAPVQYEAMFLLGPTGAQDQEAGLNLVRGMIERHGGQIMLIKRWDERKLAYELGKQKRGAYIIAYFRAPGNAVTAIERDVRLSEQVMRVMVTRADHMNQQEMNAVEPQPIQQREERNSWDRPDDRFRRDDRGPRDDRGSRDDRGPRDDRGDRPPREGQVPRGEGRGDARGPRREESPDPTGAGKN